MRHSVGCLRRRCARLLPRQETEGHTRALVAAWACPAPPVLATLADPNARPRGMMREEALIPSGFHYLHTVVPPRACLRPIAVDARLRLPAFRQDAVATWRTGQAQQLPETGAEHAI